MIERRKPGTAIPPGLTQNRRFHDFTFQRREERGAGKLEDARRTLLPAAEGLAAWGQVFPRAGPVTAFDRANHVPPERNPLCENLHNTHHSRCVTRAVEKLLYNK